MIKVINTKDAPSAIGAYSQGIEARGFIFLSGQIPIKAESGEVLRGTVAEQTEQVIQNISALLAAEGVGFENVVKTTCFLINMADFDEFNAVYAKYFVNKPARSTVAVAALPRGVSVEIEVIAAAKGQ